MFMEKMSSGGCLPPPLGYIHEYDHNIQTSSSLNHLANQSQTLRGASLGKKNESKYKWSRLHYKMATMATNSKKPL